VLLVDGAGVRIKNVRVAPLELNDPHVAVQPEPVLYPIYAVFKSLQEAADAARGGDLIAVMPGTYAGSRNITSERQEKLGVSDWVKVLVEKGLTNHSY
jgi:hypothetical protein